MTRLRLLLLSPVVLAGGLLLPSAAHAGWPFHRDGDCPHPSYSPLRYWAPALARLHDRCHGPSLSVYATDQHPEIAPASQIIRYPCPAVAPATLYNSREIQR